MRTAVRIVICARHRRRYVHRRCLIPHRHQKILVNRRRQSNRPWKNLRSSYLLSNFPSKKVPSSSSRLNNPRRSQGSHSFSVRRPDNRNSYRSDLHNSGLPRRLDGMKMKTKDSLKQCCAPPQLTIAAQRREMLRNG